MDLTFCNLLVAMVQFSASYLSRDNARGLLVTAVGRSKFPWSGSGLWLALSFEVDEEMRGSFAVKINSGTLQLPVF